MSRTRTLFHSSGLASKMRGSYWGENVGYTRGGVRSIHRAFMRSSAHRSNILGGKFRRLGIGVASSGGRMWVTEIFSS